MGIADSCRYFDDPSLRSAVASPYQTIQIRRYWPPSGTLSLAEVPMSEGVEARDEKPRRVQNRPTLSSFTPAALGDSINLLLVSEASARLPIRYVFLAR